MTGGPDLRTARDARSAAAPAAAFVAFDRFPGPKGSAVHIGRSAGALFEHFGSGLLACLGGGLLPIAQREPGFDIIRFVEPIPNLLDRADAFACFVDDTLRRHRDTLQVVQVRDPWSAAPALADPRRRHRVVYEANGFPSIELPMAWPGVPADTLAQIARIEDACLAGADAVVTPSATIAACAIRKGADPNRVTVVPNGADPVGATERPPGAPRRYLVYVGALQRWQGFGTLLRAMARLTDLDVDLVVCSSWPRRRAKDWVRFTHRLGIADRVHWVYEQPHDLIAGWLAHAEASVAPLADVARNVEQGCCPLKVVESMAAGTPVVASDLPCVRELVDDTTAKLVPPDRPAQLARALRVLLDDPAHRRALGEAGRRRAAERFTWDRADATLRTVWDGLTAPAPDHPALALR
ncbi:glycosyltransferase [Granulicoccus phenolivorans]|uniref:glycosyltransferase n=1 Tax=Granulicoccus phenolivorans TaxID=266854 RepID=UPI0004182EA1|nr:glycosyltransferase [Granulicoccus phenolivorans]